MDNVYTPFKFKGLEQCFLNFFWRDPNIDMLNMSQPKHIKQILILQGFKNKISISQGLRDPQFKNLWPREFS